MAKCLCISEGTLTNWLKKFKAKGLDGLADEARSGRPPFVPRKRLERLLKKHDTISLAEFVVLVAKKENVEYAPTYARKILRSMGYRIKKAVTVTKNAPDKIVAEKWQKDTENEVKILENDGFTVLMGDEGHHKTDIFGTGGTYTRGDPAVLRVPVPGKRVSVFGAISLDGETCYMTAKKANSDSFIKFLRHAEKQFGNIAFVTDNAAYHKSKKVTRIC